MPAENYSIWKKIWKLKKNHKKFNVAENVSFEKEYLSLKKA